MKKTMLFCAVMLACVIGHGSAQAEDKPSPEVVAGHVTKIDPSSSRVTVRGSDGKIVEFEASKETLADLKVGDRIEAKKRVDSK